MIRFGIITPTIKGREEYLRRAVASVRGQFYDDYRQIICGDGFTPAVDEKNVVRAGTPTATGSWGNGVRNYCIEHFAADFKYLVFLDDDNILLPGCLTKYARFDSDILISKMLQIMQHGQGCFPPQLHMWQPRALGSLNFCVKTEWAAQCTWPMGDYEADFKFIDDCRRVAGANGRQCTITRIDEFLSAWCTEGL